MAPNDRQGLSLFFNVVGVLLSIFGLILAIVTYRQANKPELPVATVNQPANPEQRPILIEKEEGRTPDSEETESTPEQVESSFQSDSETQHAIRADVPEDTLIAAYQHAPPLQSSQENYTTSQDDSRNTLIQPSCQLFINGTAVSLLPLRIAHNTPVVLSWTTTNTSGARLNGQPLNQLPQGIQAFGNATQPLVFNMQVVSASGNVAYCSATATVQQAQVASSKSETNPCKKHRGFWGKALDVAISAGAGVGSGALSAKLNKRSAKTPMIIGGSAGAVVGAFAGPCYGAGAGAGAGWMTDFTSRKKNKLMYEAKSGP